MIGALATVAGVAAAGALGAVVRVTIVARSGPSGTAARARGVAAVNLVGAVLLALVQLAPSPSLRLIVGLGFCGSLTTFSTWMLEAQRRVDGGTAWGRVLAVDLVAQLAVGVGLVATVLRLGG